MLIIWYKMKKIITILLIAVATSGAWAQSLDSLKQLALANSSDVSVARRNLEKAEHQKKSAFTNYFPQISAMAAVFKPSEPLMSAEIDLSKEISPETASALSQSLPPELMAQMGSPIKIEALDGGLLTNVMAMQPIYAGGQIVNGNKLANLGVEVSQIQLDDAQKSAVLDVENYYWQIVSLQYKQQTINMLDSVLQNIEKDARAAVEAGVKQRNDLLQVSLKRNELKASALELQNGILTLKRLLANLTGTFADSLQIDYPINVADGVPTSDETMGGVDATSEYRLLEKNLRAAELQQKMTTGKNMPSAMVGAGYFYNRIEKSNQDFGALFATVSIPISGWWGGSHEIKMKKIEVQNAEEMLRDNCDKLSIRLQNSFNTMLTATDKASVAALSVEQAQENLRLYSDYYQAGTCSMSDLLQAQSQYQQAVDSFAENFCNYQKAKAEYKKNSGQ